MLILALLLVLGFSLFPVPLYAGSSASVPPQVLKLGKLLFSDKRFSASGETSCRSCHRPELGFADNSAFSRKDDGSLTLVSTAALFNVKRKIGYFSLDPVFSLEDAVERCLTVNQGVSVLDIYVALKKDASLSQIATQSFGRASAGAVFFALAAYLETLETSESRYDRYLRGDFSALTSAEQMGMILFEQKGCVFCHSGTEMGGMVYGKSVSQHLNAEIPVPRLRNLSLSAPYFTDGSAESLSDAIRQMAHQFNPVPLSTHELDRIRLFLLSHESSISDFEGAVRYDYER